MTSITKKYLINGPVNVVRLTNGSKILYIFGDYHIETNNQNECIYNNLDTIDIDKLLLLFMKSNKKDRYDIFCEMYEDMYTDLHINFKTKQLNYKKRYIDNVVKLFQNNVKDKYKNFRFHYTDIRDSLLIYNILYDYFKLYIYNTKFNGRVYILLFKELKELILSFIKLLNNNKFIIKILNKYNNLKIKKQILKIYKYIYSYCKEAINLIDNLIKFITNNLMNKYIEIYYINIYENTKNNNYIIITVNKINEIISYIGVLIVDLYFIRRFLDKNYINNVILYVGGLHLVNISYLLVKYFKFKITNVNYINQPINLNKYILELSNKDILKNISNLENMLINSKNNQIYQCTDLLNFPDNFT